MSARKFSDASQYSRLDLDVAMSSSLAAQLLQGASLNSAQLLERGAKRKPTESYLFSGRDANQHDLESLHALASSAFIQLKALNPSLSVYEDGLLSDRSRLIDRTLLGAEDREELDGQLRGLLARLGRHLMEVPTGRVLEWLVRRKPNTHLAHHILGCRSHLQQNLDMNNHPSGWTRTSVSR